MSTKKNTEISGDDFIEFLAEKCSSSVCGGCGGEKFSILTSEETGAWRFEMDAVNTQQFHLPTYAAYCNNCGLVRHHSAVAINNWAKARKEKEPGLERKDDE